MKNLFWMALLAAAVFYVYTTRPQSTESVASQQPKGAPSHMGNPVREIQRAPNTLMEMQDSMGRSNAGVARSARDAVSNTVGRR